MKKKDERLADSRLDKFGIVPNIYHFEIPLHPIRAITIADPLRSREEVRQIIDDILCKLLSHQYNRSTLMKEGLHEKRVYGIAICEQRNQPNRQRGRTIAKGRLWKHQERRAKEK